MTAISIIADVRKWYDLMNMKDVRQKLWDELVKGTDIKECTEEFMIGTGTEGGIKITYKLYPKTDNKEEVK